MKRLTMLGMVLFLTIGCTDAMQGKILSYGSSAKVKCYSGGLIIYDGESTGKVKSEQSSDGYFFVDKASNKAMEVSGNCIIIYNK